jgi:hypothetical protein
LPHDARPDEAQESQDGGGFQPTILALQLVEASGQRLQAGFDHGRPPLVGVSGSSQGGDVVTGLSSNEEREVSNPRAWVAHAERGESPQGHGTTQRFASQGEWPDVPPVDGVNPV